MKKFSIDLNASGKKEMKKARKYLRYKGCDVRKRKHDIECITANYLTNWYERDILFFVYSSTITTQSEILTLPQDWDKLIEIIEGENMTKVVFDNMFDNFKKDLEIFLEIKKL